MVRLPAGVTSRAWLCVRPLQEPRRYTAVAVEPGTGRVRLIRAVAATDSGQAVNPDGIKNQIEGDILQ